MYDKQSMENTGVSLSHLPKSSALLRDYLHDFGRVAAFYNGSPFSPATYADLVRELKSKEWPRRELAAILRRQNSGFGCGEAALRNIEKLAQPGTMAVVTGQQVGLFSGPAFTLYKALTAVRLVQWLEEQNIPAVPVFWLATEDHDFAEISAANVLDEDYNLVPMSDEGERPHPLSPVGYVKLSSQISVTLARIESLLPAGESRDILIQELRRAYQSGSSWGQAFARLMTRLFGKWGVILLDPLDEEVHRLCRPVYRRALVRNDEFRRSLLERSHELVRAGYHAQVHIPDNSTLLFHEHEGGRLALHRRDGKAGSGYFYEEGSSLGAKAVEAQIENAPLSFSPNVLLRPIVQDSLLPTLAYVAGPSELAYFGQAEVLYASFDRPMPVIFPRAGFTLVDARVQRVLEKYQLKIEDAWQGEEHLARRIASTGFAAGWSERFDQSERDLGQLLGRLTKDVEVLDPTLLDALKHTEEKVRYQVDRLKGKVTRAALAKSDVLKRHEQMLIRYLLPAKDLQERQIGGIYFLGRAGFGLLDRLLAEIKTGASEHISLNI